MDFWSGGNLFQESIELSKNEFLNFVVLHLQFCKCSLLNVDILISGIIISNNGTVPQLDTKCMPSVCWGREI